MRAIKISKTRLNEMKSAIKLSDLIRYTCPDLSKFGRYKYCICPFHKEKTGSLVVNDEKGHFHCFGCGEQGDHLSFIYAKHFRKDSWWGVNTVDDMNQYFVTHPNPEREKVFIQCVRKLSQITGISIKSRKQ